MEGIKEGLRDRVLEGFKQLKAGDLDAARTTFSQLVKPIGASWQRIWGSVGLFPGERFVGGVEMLPAGVGAQPSLVARESPYCACPRRA